MLSGSLVERDSSNIQRCCSESRDGGKNGHSAERLRIETTRECDGLNSKPLLPCVV